MAKRGAGLHHLAFGVEDVAGFVSSVAGSGWLLHPHSLRSYESSRQAWLCRPGAPCLIELSEPSMAYRGDYVTALSLSIPDELVPMFEALGCHQLSAASGPRHSLVSEGRRRWLSEITG